MLIERREFLKLLGGLSGALVVGSAGMAGVGQMLDVPDQLIDRLRTGPGIETWKSTICGQCGGGCGIRVRLIDEIPVYIKGNPLHPVNQGGMCPLGHSALEVLFNPDRVKTPMRRVGPVGSGKWEPLDWQPALDRISSELSRLRQNGEAHRVPG
jgi:anaerobic selenocysteine-containing dehydrogenase